MIIVLHLLNDNRDHVTCLYWSYKFLHFLACPYITFCKQTWPNICEHIIQIGLQSSQWTNNSGHNEHHEKVNKRKTLAEKDT
jgi:hypothetical protein